MITTQIDLLLIIVALGSLLICGWNKYIIKLLMIYAYCLSVFSIHFFAKHSISVPCDPRRDSNYDSSTNRPLIALTQSYSTLTTSTLTPFQSQSS